jgi:UDP-GlcNAc:undecaprenyl-phosphate/decaprenyl-phosphate GlcNAc-1-phosphate transferase
MGMVNAINHSDGLDGLAGGESMLSLIAIAYLGYLASNDLIIALSLATIGGIVGFLRYNTHPAQVFMGDSGSQFLGFSLGFFAIYVTQVAMPAMSSALPLLFLGLPISDILVVLYKRVKGKMNWFKATRNHVHHRLLDLGFDHYETVVVIYSVQALLVTLAVLLRYQSDLLVACTYFGIIISFFLLLTVAEQRGWHRRTRGLSGIATIVEAVRANPLTKNLPLHLVSALLPLFVILGALSTEKVPRDFGVVSGVLAVITVVEIALKRERGSLAMRLSMYVAAVFSSYLFSHFGPTGDSPLHLLSIALIVVLAIAVGVFIRYTSDRNFGSTPTDYLIVFGLLALLVFGGIDSTARATVQTIIYSVVLLYGCEAMLWHQTQRFNSLTFATIISLTTLAVRGLTDLAGPFLRIAIN